MATQRLLTSVRRVGLRALGHAERPAYALYQPLRALLREHVGEEAARLIAEPVPDPASGNIDYFAAGDAAPLALHQADPAVRAAALTEVAEIADRVEAYVQKLRARGDQESVDTAEALHQALQIPDPTYLYLLDGQPVVAAWGFVPVEKKGCALVSLGPVPPPESSRESHVAAPPTASPTTAPPPQHRRWWLILLLLVLMLTLGGIWWQTTHQASAPPPAPHHVATEQPPLAQGPVDPAVTAEVVRRQEAAGAKKGAITVTLSWNDVNDLDLHVHCPDGEKIYFSHRQGCGGELDVDRNDSGSNLTPTPIEHVNWQRNMAKPGHYEVAVRYFSRRDGGRSEKTSFSVLLQREGLPDHLEHGELSLNQETKVLEFDVGS